MEYGGIIMAALMVVAASKIWRVLWISIGRPYVLTKRFTKQGVKGPPYTVCVGSLTQMKKLKMEANQTLLDPNSNDILPRVLPHYQQWCPQYGETILYWYGARPVVSITDPELIKQIFSNKFGFFLKPDCSPSVLALTGKGVALVNGMEWVRRRRIVNPAFSVDKLKVMVKRMVACTISKREKWEEQANLSEDNCVKVEMNGEFRQLTADIIAHSAFGSSYTQGKDAFLAQNDLQHCCAESILDAFIPGSHYLPTPSNLRLWKLDGRVRNSLKQIIRNRLNSCDSGSSYGDDLLGLLIGASENIDSKDGPKLAMDEIVEECKTFFFAGHETTANVLTWTVFLLSMHQDWQTRLREEVLEESGMSIPDADTLARFKLVHMVLLETLRLYCPIVEMFKQASKDIKLGNLTIPKDGWVAIPLAKIHRNKEYWGEDADEFNPIRFANGISKAAKHPNAFLAFGFGPRSCVGQNFAMMELKTVLSIILQRFSMSLSPDYKHAPVDYLALSPQYGLPIILRPLPTK